MFPLGMIKVRCEDKTAKADTKTIIPSCLAVTIVNPLFTIVLFNLYYIVKVQNSTFIQMFPPPIWLVFTVKSNPWVQGQDSKNNFVWPRNYFVIIETNFKWPYSNFSLKINLKIYYLVSDKIYCFLLQMY